MAKEKAKSKSTSKTKNKLPKELENDINDRFLFNLEETANILKIAKPTIYNWGIPKRGKKFHIHDIMDFIIEKKLGELKKTYEKEISEITNNSDEFSIRKRQAEAQLKELQLLKGLEILVDKKEMELKFYKILSDIKNNLLNLDNISDKLSNVSPPEAKGILKDHLINLIDNIVESYKDTE